MSALDTLTVTGSEAAAAIGVDPYRSPVALWADKLGLAPPREPGEAAEWGHILQPVIAGEVERRGYAVMPAPADALRSEEWPWLTGHPDGYVGKETNGTRRQGGQDFGGTSAGVPEAMAGEGVSAAAGVLRPGEAECEERGTHGASPGRAGSAGVREVREGAGARASRGLLEAAGSDVAVPELPLASASPEWLSERGILEVKTTSPYRRGEWDDDQVPPHVFVQGTVYCMLSGLRWCLVAALIGGQRLELREFEYDPAMGDLIAEQTKAFLEYVRTETPPPPDGAASTNEVLARLYPKGTGEVVELTPALAAVAARYDALRGQEKEIAKQKEEAGQTLKIALGSATVGRFEGRDVVTWAERKGYSLAAREVEASRVLRVRV